MNSPRDVVFVNRAQAWNVIRATKGRFFTVAFERRNDSRTDPTAKAGDVRIMNARLGVTAHLKGGHLAYDPERHNLQGCFDVPTGDYRMINMETLRWVKAGGKFYVVRS